jgi:hypothetical protein
MQKIFSLRSALIDAIPELKAAPKLMRIWVDRGTVQASKDRTGIDGFCISPRVNVLLMEFTGDVAALSLAVLLWLRVNQPSLLMPGQDAFSMQVDVLDAAKVDIEIQIELKQGVAVTRAAKGYTLAYVPEPSPLWADDQAPGGLAEIPLLKSVSIAGEGTLLSTEDVDNGG